MTDGFNRILSHYRLKLASDYRSALKEILQELALLGLWRAKFFEHAAFYGGTALRILHGLDRFSEDLDFSLLTPDANFSLTPYQEALEEELQAWGLDVSVKPKRKSVDSAILSAFLKANTMEQLVRVGLPLDDIAGVHPDELIKIRLEVDTNPPKGFSTVVIPILRPNSYSIRTYSLPDLFAGKLHCVLCRAWKQRVKGRDWFDLIWFIGQKVPVNLHHLELRMRQTGHHTGRKKLTPEGVQELLAKRIEELDIARARKDVAIFAENPESLMLWSRDFFHQAVKQIKVT